MPLRTKAIFVICALLFGCDRESATSNDVPTPSSPKEARPTPATGSIAPDPRLRRPTAEERASVQAKIEIAKRNPHALLDVINHGDPSGAISRTEAILFLHLYCDDWRILARVIREVEGEAQVQMAQEIASRLSDNGDFDSAHQLIDAMRPGVARATAFEETLRAQVSITGPDEMLARLHDCEPDEIVIALKGFSSGSSTYFKDNPAAGRPDLKRYESIKGLPKTIAESYVLGNARSKPHESLDFLLELEHSKWNNHVVSLLDSWAQNTNATFDKALVEKVLSIKGAVDLWAVKEKMEESGSNP